LEFDRHDSAYHDDELAAFVHRPKKGLVRAADRFAEEYGRAAEPPGITPLLVQLRFSRLEPGSGIVQPCLHAGHDFQNRRWHGGSAATVDFRHPE